MGDRADWVWMDGEMVPWDGAKVHVSADTVLRGGNIFEGMRAYWSDTEQELFIFRNAEHLRRFRQSAKIMRMTLGYSDAQLTEAFVGLLRKNRFREGVHFRPVAYFGEGEAYGYLPEEIHNGVFVLAYPKPHSKSITTGIHSCTSTWRRNSDVASPSRLKAAANYHNSRLAQVEARMNGFGVPVMLNDRGEVAESTGSCFMMVRDGVLVTPPVSADILESITRATLIELCRDALGIRVEERDIDRSEVYIADEAFLCGSAAEVLPIVSLDRYDVGDGKVGPLTRQIQQLYFDVTAGKVAKYRHWLTPVYRESEVAAAAQ